MKKMHKPKRAAKKVVEVRRGLGQITQTSDKPMVKRPKTREMWS